MTIDLEQLATWLAPVDRMEVECDGATRIIATLLGREGISFATHMGALVVDGIGRIRDHWWTVLDDDTIVDYRARMWLRQDPRVQHGVFRPNADHHFLTSRTAVMADDPFSFFILASMPLERYPRLRAV